MGKVMYEDYQTGKINGSAFFRNLPSGKLVNKRFDKNGIIQEEMHYYGYIDIGIQYHFKNGKISYELYFFKKHMVTRIKYEKERLLFKDMPAANNKLEDISGEIVRGANREKREKYK
jgi:hypothetical protein